MKDPLIHLVRNCLDHGIEIPAERTRRGKPPCGTLAITISARNGSNVELLIADDGGGIDVKRSGLPPGNCIFSRWEKRNLSLTKKRSPSSSNQGFPPVPLSPTSPVAASVSAIVKEKVEKLNGALSVESELNQGTSFRIILPLTLARFHGVIVQAGEQLFVFPTSHVERVVRIKKEDIKTIENRETISLGGQAISLARLHEVLGLLTKVAADHQPDVLPAVVLASANQRIAFVVDEVLNEQEVLVKTLGKQLVRVRNIAGATVLGSGKVVPILNVPDLIKTGRANQRSGNPRPGGPGENN